jgi:hypothetical protein
MERSLNKIVWKGFVEFRPHWAGTGSIITVETSREWGWKSAAYAYCPLSWRLPWLKIVVVRTLFMCFCCLAKTLSLCCCVSGVAFSCHCEFFDLIGPTCWSSDWFLMNVPHNEAPGTTAYSLTWQHLLIRAPLRGDKCHKTLALNPKGVYPPKVDWVQSDCRVTGRGRGAHRPCRVQWSPQESRMS